MNAIGPQEDSSADRLALHELAARYGDLIDARDWSGLGSIFTETATFDATDIHGGVREGLSQIQSYMATEAQHPDAHLITNIYVERLDADESQMRSRLVAVQKDGSVATGEYHDTLLRTPVGWRIERRVFKYHRRTNRA